MNTSRAFALTGALLLALAAAAATQAAEEQSDESSDTAVTAQPVSVTKKKPAPKIQAQSAESADSYEASEEVSEDLAVSYPVDI